MPKRPSTNPTLQQVHTFAWWRAIVASMLPQIDLHTREDIAARAMAAALMHRSRRVPSMLVARRRILDAMKMEMRGVARLHLGAQAAREQATHAPPAECEIIQLDDARALAKKICALLPRDTAPQRRAARRAYTILVALSSGDSVADAAAKLRMSAAAAHLAMSRVRLAAAQHGLRLP